MKKTRIVYAGIFCILFLIEICIALFVHDNFIRPYVGDVIVTILLCCLCRTIIPKAISALPIYVFALAVLVEVAQYLDIVKLLSLENNTLISTIIGTTFSSVDLICYGIGCLVFWLTERLVNTILKHRNVS